MAVMGNLGDSSPKPPMAHKIADWPGVAGHGLAPDHGLCPRLRTNPGFITFPNQTFDQMSDPAVARMPVTSLVPDQADVELFT